MVASTALIVTIGALSDMADTRLCQPATAFAYRP
jgi:hypothetical protein